MAPDIPYATALPFLLGLVHAYLIGLATCLAAQIAFAQPGYATLGLALWCALGLLCLNNWPRLTRSLRDIVPAGVAARRAVMLVYLAISIVPMNEGWTTYQVPGSCCRWLF